ncbi:MAG: nuclease [Acidobacteriota bacterium]|jgi:heat shock protein HspQ|nr:nuclease [Acidobacteriota bacterium]
MRVSRIAALAVLLLALPGSASAWGPTGHRVVGRIAEHHLTPEAQRGVVALLGPDSLARVSTWADDIRSDPNWKKSTPWHFLSIDDNETLETTARAPEGDVLEAMQRFEKVLRDPQADRQSKADALKFLVHFVGDVHQPLHVGRRADRGGNEIIVLWFSEPSNLHSVWDNGMIDATKLSFSELAEFIDHPTPEEVAAWQRATYADWIRESFDARPQVYDIGKRDLSFDYAFRNMSLVEKRLVQAGVRLAGLLNSVFATLSPPPGAP